MTTSPVTWHAEVLPIRNTGKQTRVLVARNVPYLANANARQNLNIYLPHVERSSNLAGARFQDLTSLSDAKGARRWHVHIHGGAWRDPFLRSSSIEAAAALALSADDHLIAGIISIDYTLSPFPTHPTLPYDPAEGDHSDPSRAAKHPNHVDDVLHAFEFLQAIGLRDESYILTGHSAGACLAFQSNLLDSRTLGVDIPRPPRPAALIGLNGLYDLPDLVHELGSSHQHLAQDYQNLLGHAFGTDESQWPAASPARVDTKALQGRLEQNECQSVVLIDQSAEDQLVPMNEADKMEAVLKKFGGLRVARGTRCKGRHAAPWEEGNIIWETIQDVLALLEKSS